MLYAVRDLKSGSMIAISTTLPKPEVIYDMAKDRRRHVSVTSGAIEIFNTKWYLPKLEA